jgi:LysM repeat protein
MRVRAGLVSAAIVVAIAGCGGSSATPSPSPGSTDGQSTEAPAATETTAATNLTPTLPPEEVTPEPTVEVPAETAAPEGTEYVVKKGDTMYAIAKKFGITLQALIDANPQVKDPRKLQVGQKLTIPPAP